ncbi:MAG: hypothetical protein ACKVRO_04770 [Micropepsaceae bacterium]
MTQLEAMALTFAIESAVAAALAPAFGRAALWCAAAAIAGSTVTHPVLWALFYEVQAIYGVMATPVLEAAVIAAETFSYRILATTRWDEAALLSVLANAASWWGGELIYALT